MRGGGCTTCVEVAARRALRWRVDVGLGGASTCVDVVARRALRCLLVVR